MKKVRKIAILIIFYIGIIFINTQVLATTGVTESETTRMREEASTDSDTVILISINEEVEIISEDGEWYKVTYKNDGNTYTGYIRKDLLKVDGEETTQSDKSNETSNNETENEDVEEDVEESSNGENSEESQTEVSEESTEAEQTVENSSENTGNLAVEQGVTGQISKNIEIRILPLVQSSKLGTIKSQTEVEVSEIVGNWCYIESDSQSGWVMVSNLEGSLQQANNDVEESEDTSEEEKTTEEETSEEEDSEDTSVTKTLYINAETVNMREEASSSSDILKQLALNTEVTVVEEVDETWSKVTVSGLTGYIVTQYLSESKTEVTSRSSSESRTEKEETTESSDTSETSKTKSSSSSSSNSSSSNSSDSKTSETTTSSTSSSSSTSAKSTSTESEDEEEVTSSKSSVTGDDIVAYAKKFLGYKYVSGGASPSTGFDCSGLTYYVYGQNGYSLNRTSSAQASNGKKVSKSDLKAGDLVFFTGSTSKTTIGHVGIYIGGNQFIHSANSRKGVIITSLSNSYYTATYVTARRIIY